MYYTAGRATAKLRFTDFGTRLCHHMEVCSILRSKSQRRTFERQNVFNWSIVLAILILSRVYIFFAIVLTREDTLTVSIKNKTLNKKFLQIQDGIVENTGF